MWLHQKKELVTLDIGTPSDMKILASQPQDSLISELHLSGNRLFGLNADEDNTPKGMSIFSLTEQSRPALLLNYGAGNSYWSIDVFEDTMYLSSMDGIDIVDISDVNRADSISSISSVEFERLQDIKFSGDILFSTIQDGFKFFDLTEPQAPAEFLEYKTYGSEAYNAVEVSEIDDSVFWNVYDDRDLIGWSFLIKSNPKSELSWIDVESPRDDTNDQSYRIHDQSIMEMSNEKIYLGSRFGLKVIDPYADTIKSLALYKMPESPYVIDVADNTALVAMASGLMAFNTDTIISSTDQYTHANTAEALVYHLFWDDELPVEFKCFVSAGECQLALDVANKNATVTWTMPADAGHAEISIVGGNLSFYNVFHDQVIVE
ncbi:hypothetical protein DXX93_05770 [Thalassotalea euphylliae]|uniref:Uncharacterized protein n=1 Tax=Thalassotalea euphylliae TaxID=1655234 RepID=A0A3E0TNM6_9GAMM|nr:hypothetical protein [Thalassotalea euphylliae]REL26134.1 hypothetical protein DXX93_05770 [Thalassotalea euphylliae]